MNTVRRVGTHMVAVLSPLEGYTQPLCAELCGEVATWCDRYYGDVVNEVGIMDGNMTLIVSFAMCDDHRDSTESTYLIPQAYRARSLMDNA